MHSRKLSPISIFAAVLAFSGLATGAFAQSPYDNALKNLRFRSIGPAVMGGRLDDIAVVESDPRIIYIGAAGGGLFKTVNGGADDMFPQDMEDISKIPNLVRGLMERGFSDADILKILGGNTLRVMRAVQQAAQQ
jgi:hypothetical protein